MSVRRWFGVIAGAATLTGACGGDPGDVGVAVTEQDGVPLVSVSADAIEGTPPWALDPEPLLTIGVLDGPPEYLFGSVSAAAILESGHIVVIDGQSFEARVYDADGTWVATRGGTGQGPLEFASPASVWALGGSRFAVVDTRLQKVVTFDAVSDSAAVETIQAGSCLAVQGAAACSVRGILPSGALVTAVTSMRTVSDPFAPGEVRVVPGSEWLTGIRTESQTRPLDALSGGSNTVVEFAGGSIWYFPTPFDPAHALAVGRDHVVFGDGAAGTLRVWSSDGALERTIRLPDGWAPSVADLVEPIRAWADTGDSGYPITRYLDQAQFPETAPAFGGVHIEPSGRIWLGSYTPDSELAPAVPVDWLILAPSGVPMGRIDDGPAPDDLLHAGDGVVLVRDSGPGDVPMVRVLRVGPR